MTQYIYMNHRIREKKPSGPVIVLQNAPGHDTPLESNVFDIWYHGEKIGRVVYNPKGLDACETHDVKAWVEFDDLVIVADPKGYKDNGQPEDRVASVKNPNSPVQFVLKTKKA